MRVFLATVLWLQTTVLSLTSGISTEDSNVTSPSLKPDVSLEDTTWLSVGKEENASSLNSFLEPSSSAWWEMYENDENCIRTDPKGPKWWGTYKFVSRVGISCTGKFKTRWEAQSWSPGPQDVYLKHYNNTVKIELSDSSLGSAKSVWVMLYCSSLYQHHYICTAEMNVTIVPGAKVQCNSSSECISRFHEYSSCVHGSCICNDDGTSGLTCPARVDRGDAIFKAAMVAVACFAAVVVSVFLLFCYNRAKICRALRTPHLHAEREDQRPNDIFNVSDQLARERLADKPPTYQEIIRSDRENRGIPPPAYDSTVGESCTSLQPSAPSLDQSDDSPEHRSIVRLATTLQTITLATDATPNSVTRTAVHNNNLRRSNTMPPSYDNAAFTNDV